MPSQTARSIRSIFEKHMFSEGFDWKRVPKGYKEEYFTQFKLEYNWPEKDETLIKDAFMRHAGRRYSDMVSSWKKKWNGNKQKPKCVTEIDWSSKWIPHWNTPEVKEKSEKMSNNRLTDVGGGCSKHSGGSKSSVAHMETLKRKSSDKEPTLFDLHKETHMRKNGTFVDDRAKRICEDYENRLIEESTTRTLTTAEQNEIYKEIAGVKKQRVYGIGSMSGSYGSDGRTSASCLLENGTKEAEFNQLKNELADEKAKVAKLEETVDLEKKNREKIEEKLDCEKKNREKIEEKLERLIERVNDSLGEPFN